MRYQREKGKLLLYTREVLPEEYPDGLARSIHLAYSRDGKCYQALHDNYGILFAPGLISEKDTIVPKGLKHPEVFELPGGRYGITAERVNEDGSEDSGCQGKVLFWTTEDFMEFELQGLADRHSLELEAMAAADKLPEGEAMTEQTAASGRSEGAAIAKYIGAAQLPKGAIAGGSVEISANLCDRLVQYWDKVYNTEVRVPECVTVSSAQELSEVSALAVYSDGSTAKKQVLWEMESIDFDKAGSYKISGTVQNEEYSFPVARGYGDPVLFSWKGSWYFIATNDNTDDVGLYVRRAETPAGLFEPQTEEHLILGRDETGEFWQTFWAPEFHVIGGALYILFAVGGKVWGPQCYVMRLREDGDILNPTDWERPVRIRRQDGSWLSTDGITLDMTYLRAGKRSYVVWSYRRHIGTPDDTGSMLYIAEIEEETPWQLKSEPVLLSRPLLGWENVSGTINNEGPHSFVSEGTVYLAYSGGSANRYTYVLGLLTAQEDADLLDVKNWKKSGFPVLSFYSVAGEYGPGHNSFFEDDFGNLMIAYHAEDAIDHMIRCDGIRRVHFAVDGRPLFDLSAERDLNPGLRRVTMRVEVPAEGED